MLASMPAAAAAAANLAPANRFLLGGPIFFKSDDPRELAREHKRLGYAAAYCPAAKPADTARLQAIEAAVAVQAIEESISRREIEVVIATDCTPAQMVGILTVDPLAVSFLCGPVAQW